MRRITMAEYIDSFKTAERDVPDTNVGDPISRQAAIKAINDLLNCSNGYSDTYDKACIIDLIDELPTIDPVKHGKWTEINIKDYKALCSECGTWSPVMGKFCPECGARMDGE